MEKKKKTGKYHVILFTFLSHMPGVIWARLPSASGWEKGIWAFPNLEVNPAVFMPGRAHGENGPSNKLLSVAGVWIPFTHLQAEQVTLPILLLLT